ncbi:MAG: hydrolase [Sphingomonas sp.]|uniref:HAD family hydrolase n=1 Tax=Sphingomonas sp. TaxID=28214 RepID=UPI001AC56D9B|nr:HAD family hydrolase [Sphingomonas sp.]MBN8807092.1 hydrolase [Sphingomonas sp.]
MLHAIRAYDVATLLDHAPAGIEILSLDCFDTLIWRNTHAPTDVFAELPAQGGGVEPRMWAEARARRSAWLHRKVREIGLADIYREMMADPDDADIADAVAAELAIERRHAFAFAPTVALMREARRRGLGIVIVSDMYLTEAQLRAHIAAAAGDEVMAMIDHVFVSNSHGEGKCDGLFAHVLKTLGVTGDKVLHLGDNHAADYLGAVAHGIHGVHLEQFDAETASRLRMEDATARILDPACGITRPTGQPHRAAVALRRHDDPTYVLGHDVMGPAMTTYAHWVKAELDAASAAAGKPVKPLFVMRDGYLPFQVFDKLYPEIGARKVDLSRFVALRAALSDEAALERHLDEWTGAVPIASLARQLMLFENEYARFLKADTKTDKEKQSAALAKRVRSDAGIRRKIFARRAAFLDRMVAHMRSVGIEPGDTVMLVDTGYNGTVQNLVTPVLAEAMGVSVIGRYVFLREKRRSGLDKRGMIDLRNYDFRTLHALSLSIVALEQLCNVEMGSTIDFTATGEAVREKVDRKATHNATRDAIQAACMDYVRQGCAAILTPPAADDLDSRCRAAAAVLARLAFLPNAGEVSVFQRFDFDFNMGVAVTDVLVDTDRGRAGLRRRGLPFYSDQMPQFLSAELQSQGLPVSLASFAASRFRLDLRTSDFEVGGVDVPVILASSDGDTVMDFAAFPTTDGYYHLRVPIGAQRPTIAIQLGRQWEWLQVEECGYLSLADLQKGHAASTIAVRGGVDAMEEVAPNLFHAAPNGVLIVMPPAGDKPMVLSLVFRPILDRKPTVELRAVA